MDEKTMEMSLDSIKQEIQHRKKTDKHLSIIWLVVFLLPLLLGFFASLYLMTVFIEIFSNIDFSNPQSYDLIYDSFSQELMFFPFIFGIIGVINLFSSFIINYLLINRRRSHFNRQNDLFNELGKVLFYLGKENVVDSDFNQSFNNKSVMGENYDHKRNPILWSILSVFIPFIQFYVFYFLMNDFYLHERFEDAYWEGIKKELDKFGIIFSYSHRKKAVPDRSFIFYLILTIVSAGLFIVYWIYVLIQDPNDHFKYHVEIENQLLSSIESIQF
jgi:hypothetical protein